MIEGMTSPERVREAAAGKLSREELIERARSLIPVVRQRAPQAEELRRLPAETVQDFVDAGFVRACVPERFGGMEHEVDIAVELALLIARGCSASGWLASFYPLHNWMVGWLPEQGQAEVWADSPNVLISTAPAFVGGTFEAVDGGIRATADLKFSSGVDAVDWLFVMGSAYMLVVPRSDFEIVDDWFVTGLKGTGSKGVRLENVFVPEHRLMPTSAVLGAAHHGTVWSQSPYYHVMSPVANVLDHFILAPLIGITWGVVDMFEERVSKRIDPQVGRPAHTRPGAQLRFAEAHAEVAVAEMLLRKNLEQVREWGTTRVQPTAEQRATIRRNIVYAAKLCTQATNRLVDGADTSAIRVSADLHRQAADVRAGASHRIFQPEETFLQFSAVRWGLEPLAPI
jgi:3-hydroxy-9,10-secoandrosta-1,3,5(10)-triene-9,17-dione monooxygenase